MCLGCLMANYLFLISDPPKPTLTVQPAPTSGNTLKTQVHSGPTATLTCTAPGVSASYFKFIFIRYRTGREREILQLSPKSIYTISSLSIAWLGRYVCIVSNLYGDESAESNSINIELVGEYVVNFDVVVNVSISSVRLNIYICTNRCSAASN